MITTLRTAAAEIRRAIAASGAGAILAAWFGPVLADIALGAGRCRGVAGRLPRTAEARRDGVPAPVGRVAPVACPVRARAAEVTAWDLPPVFDRGRPYVDYYPRRAA